LQALRNENQFLKGDIQDMQDQRDELESNLDGTNQYARDMENKVKSSSEVSSNLLQILRQREEEAQNLKRIEIVEEKPTLENV